MRQHCVRFASRLSILPLLASLGRFLRPLYVTLLKSKQAPRQAGNRLPRRFSLRSTFQERWPWPPHLGLYCYSTNSAIWGLLFLEHIVRVVCQRNLWSPTTMNLFQSTITDDSRLPDKSERMSKFVRDALLIKSPPWHNSRAGVGRSRADLRQASVVTMIGYPCISIHREPREFSLACLLTYPGRNVASRLCTCCDDSARFIACARLTLDQWGRTVITSGQVSCTGDIACVTIRQQAHLLSR
jgi:hypothetical protein